MRYWLVLLVLSLAACADDGLTRSFGTNRDSGPEITAPGQMPLSTPPALSDRPKRPGLLALNGDAAGQPLKPGTGQCGPGRTGASCRPDCRCGRPCQGR